MVGIQHYPVSYKALGTDAFMDHAAMSLLADTFILCINEIYHEVFENNPLAFKSEYKTFVPYGKYCFKPEPKYYESSSIIPPVENGGALKEFDALKELAAGAKQRSLKSYAWIQTLHLEPILKERPDLAMIDINGKPL
ncbi:MAG: hypothetical protein ABIA63_03710, partial [bacterium]